MLHGLRQIADRSLYLAACRSRPIVQRRQPSLAHNFVCSQPLARTASPHSPPFILLTALCPPQSLINALTICLTLNCFKSVYVCPTPTK